MYDSISNSGTLCTYFAKSAIQASLSNAVSLDQARSVDDDVDSFNLQHRFHKLFFDHLHISMNFHRRCHLSRRHYYCSACAGSKLSILANWLRLLTTYRRSARLVVEPLPTTER